MIIKSPLVSKRFIPEWNGNKELPASEQIIINFRALPGASEKSNYVKWQTDKSSNFSITYKDSELVTAYVEKIENLTDSFEDGTTRKIRNGIDLAACKSPEVVDLIGEIRDYLFPAKNDEDLDEGESEA